jgi:hypothetical protein
VNVLFTQPLILTAPEQPTGVVGAMGVSVSQAIPHWYPHDRCPVFAYGFATEMYP